jgi:RNA polymerase sigma-70 factor (ECF subfamily)
MESTISQAGAMGREYSAELEAGILARCRAGDWSDYGLIVERYRRLVWAAVDAVLVGDESIPDVVQEVFIRAYEKLHTWRGDGQLSTWLYRLARNHALNHLRRLKRNPARISLEASEDTGRGLKERLAAASVPDDAYAADAQQAALRQMLASLPEDYRQTLNMFYLHEMSQEEIAEVTGKRINTIKTHLRRGRMKLARMAAEQGWA